LEYSCPFADESDFITQPVTFVLLFFATTIPFFVCDRYRAPLLPALLILGSFGLSHLVDAIKQKLIPIVASSSIVLIVCFFLVNSNLYALRNSSPARDALVLGIIALNENRNNEAIVRFQEALALDSSFPNLNYNMGVVTWMQGNPDSAIHLFHRELELNFRSFSSLINLSQIHFGRREVDLAFGFAQRAVAVKPYLPGGYVWLAKAYVVKSEIIAAESVLAQGAQMCGKNEFVYGEYLRGNIHHSQGRIDQAEDIFRTVLERINAFGRTIQPLYEPEFDYSVAQKIGEDLLIVESKVHFSLGEIFMARNNLDTAVTHLEAATELDTTFADAFAALGVVNLRLRRIREAQAALGRSVELNSRNFLFWFNYGYALLAGGKREDAMKAFETSLRINPDFLQTREILTQLKGPLPSAKKSP
jgi:tetratricopeptide (TPR) repeat protein